MNEPPRAGIWLGGLKWTISDLTAKKKVILAGLGWGGLPACPNIPSKQKAEPSLARP